MQGFNQGRYVPPEHEGVRSGNSLHNRRAAGVPRRDGTQTVRFEMPFAVWCATCAAKHKSQTRIASGSQTTDGRTRENKEEKEEEEEMIGTSGVGLIPQGVRFNATKSRVGNYYSTPIWNFTLKHASCGGKLEIRTDPKNTRYIVHSGGKARDYGEANDPTTSELQEGGRAGGRAGAGETTILTPAEREQRKEDAFTALEGKIEEKATASERETRVRELYEESQRDWKDPWTANRRIREGFRRERKVRMREEERVGELQRRIGTGMEILPEREEDGRRARLVAFGFGDEEGGGDASGRGEGGFDGGGGGTNASGAVLFKPTNPPVVPSSRLGKKGAVESRKDVLRKQLLQNTRAVMNPFG